VYWKIWLPNSMYVRSDQVELVTHRCKPVSGPDHVTIVYFLLNSEEAQTGVIPGENRPTDGPQPHEPAGYRFRRRYDRGR